MQVLDWARALPSLAAGKNKADPCDAFTQHTVESLLEDFPNGCRDEAGESLIPNCIRELGCQALTVLRVCHFLECLSMLCSKSLKAVGKFGSGRSRKLCWNSHLILTLPSNGPVKQCAYRV